MMTIIYGLVFWFGAQEIPSNWETHKFEMYNVQFKTPPSWNVDINNSGEKSYIECTSRDNEIYFFLTVAENEMKTTPEILLSYLKVTYGNCDFIREETKTIHGIDFLFSIGINTNQDVSSYIRLGVGKKKNWMYMIDSGFNNVNSDQDEELLNQIISTIKPVN